MFRFDSLSRVRDHDLYRITTFHQRRRDINLADHGALERLGGVIYQIGDGAFHGVTVREYYWEVRRQTGLNRDSIQASAEQLQGAFDDCVDFAWPRLCRGKACKRGEFIDELANSLDGVRDRISASGHYLERIFIGRSAAFKMAANTIGRKSNGRERILDLMGNATRNLSPGGLLLRAQ